MMWTDDMRQFVVEHQADDTSRLLLSAHRYPDIDVPFAVEQIESRRRLRLKLPQWYSLPDLLMGGRISAEQCSSEQTARFKRKIMLPGARTLCDMTGGLGVDFWYMSLGLETAIYTERQHTLCQVARHNFPILSAAHDVTSDEIRLLPANQIEVREGIATQLPIPDVDVIYLDPARRANDGSRVYEISECEPDVVTWQRDLLSHCRQLIVKVSPMADISRTVSRLMAVQDVYVVSLKGECKELLIVQVPGYNGSVTVHCVDLFPSRDIHFQFALCNREPIQPVLASSVLRYFYEPDISIMKAQCFSALSQNYGLAMLDRDCHYFTSDHLIVDFPGRIFEVVEQIEFSSRRLKRLKVSIPQANIACRNFPLTSDALRSRCGIRDGGEVFLFGATVSGQGPVLVRCAKVSGSV